MSIPEFGSIVVIIVVIGPPGQSCWRFISCCIWLANAVPKLIQSQKTGHLALDWKSEEVLKLEYGPALLLACVIMAKRFRRQEMFGSGRIQHVEEVREGAT
jgi:hypothetical protein